MYQQTDRQTAIQTEWEGRQPVDGWTDCYRFAGILSYSLTPFPAFYSLRKC